MNLYEAMTLGFFMAVGVCCAVGMAMAFIASGRVHQREWNLAVPMFGLCSSVGVVTFMLSYGA
tara:strand:- start:2410 stop:2598 length:189 start_codon:yes stop_codon:yes gene_type:complete